MWALNGGEQKGGNAKIVVSNIWLSLIVCSIFRWQTCNLYFPIAHNSTYSRKNDFSLSVATKLSDRLHFDYSYSYSITLDPTADSNGIFTNRTFSNFVRGKCDTIFFLTSLLLFHQKQNGRCKCLYYMTVFPYHNNCNLNINCNFRHHK